MTDFTPPAPMRPGAARPGPFGPANACAFGFYAGEGYDRAGQWHGPLIPHFEKREDKGPAEE